MLPQDNQESRVERAIDVVQPARPFGRTLRGLDTAAAGQLHDRQAVDVEEAVDRRPKR